MRAAHEVGHRASEVSSSHWRSSTSSTQGRIALVARCAASRTRMASSVSPAGPRRARRVVGRRGRAAARRPRRAGRRARSRSPSSRSGRRDAVADLGQQPGLPMPGRRDDQRRKRPMLAHRARREGNEVGELVRPANEGRGHARSLHRTSTQLEAVPGCRARRRRTEVQRSAGASRNSALELPSRARASEKWKPWASRAAPSGAGEWTSGRPARTPSATHVAPRRRARSVMPVTTDSARASVATE